MQPTQHKIKLERVYDAVIVGGGSVGLSLALALGQQNYQVLLIEQQGSAVQSEDFDARTIALSFASKRIFECLTVWSYLSSRAIPIDKVIVSMKGQFGRSQLKTPNEHDALGYVVGAHEIEQALYKALAKQTTVEVLRPAKVLARDCTSLGWQLTVSGCDTPILCNLLVASDGVHSQLRQEQQIDATATDYHHNAVLTNVEMRDLPTFTAIERFLPNGAIALLPWQNHFATCVWTTTPSEATTLRRLDDDAFLQACEAQLGKRLGKITKCSTRHYFPLTMSLANHQVSARFLLMGNAAHSLHPIAAQGFNLSLRDIWQIRSFIIKSTEQKCDIGSPRFLEAYAQTRRSDQARVIFATDKIARFMSSETLPSPLRAMGITLFDCVPPLKQQFVQIAMGLP